MSTETITFKVFDSMEDLKNTRYCMPKIYISVLLAPLAISMIS